MSIADSQLRRYCISPPSQRLSQAICYGGLGLGLRRHCYEGKTRPSLIVQPRRSFTERNRCRISSEIVSSRSFTTTTCN